MDDFGMGYALGSESGADKDGGFMGNNGIIWLVLILLLFGGGGFGFGGNRGALGVAELQSSFNFNDLQNAVRGLERGVCDSTFALNNTINGGFHGVDTAMCAGFNGVNNAINQSRYDVQQCCCETQKAIESLRVDMSNNTQRIIDTMTANQIQDLRDKLAAKDRDVLAANFQLSQLSQNATLIGTLAPRPIPAYTTCSPYAAATMCGGCVATA